VLSLFGSAVALGGCLAGVAMLLHMIGHVQRHAVRRRRGGGTVERCGHEWQRAWAE
jgi:hypothetical protein